MRFAKTGLHSAEDSNTNADKKGILPMNNNQTTVQRDMQNPNAHMFFINDEDNLPIISSFGNQDRVDVSLYLITAKSKIQ